MADGGLPSHSRLTAAPPPLCGGPEKALAHAFTLRADKQSEGRTGHVSPPQGRGESEDASRPDRSAFAKGQAVPASVKPTRAVANSAVGS